MCQHKKQQKNHCLLICCANARYKKTQRERQAVFFLFKQIVPFKLITIFTLHFIKPSIHSPPAPGRLGTQISSSPCSSISPGINLSVAFCFSVNEHTNRNGADQKKNGSRTPPFHLAVRGVALMEVSVRSVPCHAAICLSV